MSLLILKSATYVLILYHFTFLKNYLDKGLSYKRFTMFTLFKLGKIFFSSKVITEVPLVGNQKWYTSLPAFDIIIDCLLISID